jgi:hypothetical protein
MTSEPRADRPVFPAGYGIPSTPKGLLPWSFVTERLEAARNYWVASTRPDGRPHTVAVWGVVVDGALYHGGGSDTVKARNVSRDPRVSIHLESADEVVIIEGVLDKLTEDNADPELLRRVDAAYEAKYGMPHGTPVWRLDPIKAFAWSEFPTTVTRFGFDEARR